MRCSLLKRMALMLCLLLIGSGSIYGQNQDTDSGEILATVNGTPIQRAQLDEEILWLKTSAGLDVTVENAALAALSNEDYLENLIDRQLLIQEAHRKQLRISSRLIDSALAAVEARFPSDAAFAGRLSDAGLDKSLFRERLITGLLVKRLLYDEITHSIRVSEIELQAFYRDHPEDFILHDQTRALNILIAVKNEGDRGAALLKIETIALKLSKGADFAALAMAYSDDPSRTRGGDLGYFTYDQVIPAFGDAVFALQPGQTSDVVETPLGYHLIRVIDRIPLSRLRFEEAREKIDYTIRLNKENRAIRTYIADLRQQANIVRHPVSPSDKK